LFFLKKKNKKYCFVKKKTKNSADKQ